MPAPAANVSIVPPFAAPTVPPPDGRLMIHVDLTPEALTLLNPLGWAGALNDLLIRQFGITLANLVAFLVLSFFFWKVLVLFVLPGIYFRVMLYTDEMEADNLPRGLVRPTIRHGWTLAQVLDAVFKVRGIS